ncbi:MAG: hypothetical protein ABJB33_02605 [Gemmatimonadota bacterium]
MVDSEDWDEKVVREMFPARPDLARALNIPAPWSAALQRAQLARARTARRRAEAALTVAQTKLGHPDLPDDERLTAEIEVEGWREALEMHDLAIRALETCHRDLAMIETRLMRKLRPLLAMIEGRLPRDFDTAA